jgi:ribonuclease-3
VSSPALAEVGRSIELSHHILVGKSQLEEGGSFREALVADVFEAILGAIFVEAGFDIALQVIRKLFATRLVSVSPRDPKTELQEQLHLLKRGAPEYFLEETKGSGHKPLFVSLVKIDGQEYGRGEGSSKKSSQQEAAEKALARLFDEEQRLQKKSTIKNNTRVKKTTKVKEQK